MNFPDPGFLLIEKESSELRADILEHFREPHVGESYDEWSKALQLEQERLGAFPTPKSFSPSREIAAADSANRFAPEDWEIRSFGYPSPQTVYTSDEQEKPLPF